MKHTPPRIEKSPVAYDNMDTNSRTLAKKEGKQGYVFFEGKWYLATCKNDEWHFEVADE